MQFSIRSLALVLSASLIFAGQTAAQTPAISLESHSVRLLDVNVDASRYSKVAELTMFVRNNSSARITAWRVMATFTDPFGDEMFKIQLTSGNTSIAPRDIAEARFSFEDNQFIDDEPYDNLASYAASNIKITLDDIRVVN